MGVKQPFVLADGTAFGSIGEANAYCKAMLWRYDLGDRVNERDSQTFRCLVEGHDHYQEKAGPGIDHFEVRQSIFYSKRCFFIVRVDGTSVDVSYGKCVRASAKKAKKQRVVAIPEPAVAMQSV